MIPQTEAERRYRIGALSDVEAFIGCWIRDARRRGEIRAVDDFRALANRAAGLRRLLENTPPLADPSRGRPAGGRGRTPPVRIPPATRRASLQGAD